MPNQVDDIVYKFMLTPLTKRFFANSIPGIPLLRPPRQNQDSRSPEELKHYLGMHYLPSDLYTIHGTILLRLMFGAAWVTFAAHGYPKVAIDYFCGV
jgi:hypothetical protein